MQPGATTCTEDRILHALERCLHGLSLNRRSTSWSAGLCLNCWSLQELVSRDPGHFLILLEQILQKTREVQEKGTYDLLTPLALLFYSTVLCTPHFPPDSDLLLKAARTYHRFLTWPVPYCSICQELLTFIDAELKAPGISYQRLVRAEQGLPIRSHRSSTVTVLLLNPVEVQAEFLAVANKLSAPEHSPHSTYVTLLLHAFQATFGTHLDLPGLHCRLQSKSLAELEDIFTETAEAQELASGIGDAAEARQWLRTKLQAVGEKAGFTGVLDTATPGKLHTIRIPVARCYTYNWNQDSFDILEEILLKEQELLQPGILGDDEEEEEEEESKAGGEDQLWRPYYSYKPKRKAGAAGAGSSGASGMPRGRRPPRWRQKLERRSWEETPAAEGPAGRARGERRHRCGDCAQIFTTLRKLRKHQEAHSGGSHSSRAGRRPSTRFTCPHCAKVCKTAAALSRHGQRHAAERPGGTPTPVIAYSKGSIGTRPRDVKEEAPQEMQVSSSSGEAGGGSAAAEEASETASLQDPVISGGEEPPVVAGGGTYAYQPVQEFPLALIGSGREPGSGRGKPGSEGPVGAGEGDRMEGMGAAKVTFYPEPYPLVYGPQLLAAYPYNFSNLAALPVALNMVLPDEKSGGALPFLPGVFGYAVNPQAAAPTPPTPPPPTLPPPVPPKGEGERAGVEGTQKGDVG